MNDLLLTDSISFENRPDAVPYHYRISYKIPQICLILHNFCRGKSGISLIKIHIYSNAINDEVFLRELETYLSNKDSSFVVKFDPAINRALNYALADRIIEPLPTGTYRLSELGKQFVRQICADKDLLRREKAVLELLGKRLTDKKIKELASAWRYQTNVANKSSPN